jgi:ankyrin repeat protein
MSGSISRVFILIAFLVVFQCSKALPNTGLFQSTKDEGDSKEESVYAEVPTNVDGINDFDEHGRTYLIDAALAGDADAIANYIKAGALVDVTTSDGNTALLLAAKNGLYLACMELINHGANLEHKNALGISPLLISVIMGHKLLVQSMLDHNADPNVALPDGTSALMLAAQKGRDEIIHLLLNKGANVNAQSVPGTTPLMFACMSHQLSTVQAVLSAHPALEKKESREGLSALSYAAARGLSDIILELLKAGADIESKDAFGRTPIEVAIFKRQQSAIDTLAIYGAHLPKKGFRLSKETLDARSKYMEEKARTKPHVQYYGREIKVDRKGS